MIIDTKRAGYFTNRRHIILQSFVTFFAFSMRLDVYSADGSALLVFAQNLLGSITGFSIVHAILLPCIYLLYRYIDSRIEDREKVSWTVIVPALLFSLFVIFGYSFAADNSWKLVMNVKNGQSLKALIVFLGYFIFFLRVIAYLYRLTDEYCTGKKSGLFSGKRVPLMERYFQALASHPFRTVFLSMLVLYIPYSVASFPAVFMGDTTNQVCQAFSELRYVSYLKDGLRLADDVFINQHHPVLHTMLIHWCLLLGDAVCHSFNVGIFIYAMIQEFCILLAISYAVSVLLRTKAIRKEYILVVVLYTAFHPLIRDFMFLVTKDIIYSAILIILLTNCYLLLLGERSRRVLIGFGLASIGIVLFRNDARYALILSLFVMALIVRDMRKTAVITMVSVIVFSAVFFKLLLPMLYITPGSVREMLSVPFQQTARYVLYHSDEVTEEEREAIEGILDYDELAKLYNPDLSDPVKETFKEESDGTDLIRYFKAWAGMLVKHPGTYIQATMNNYYCFFYPGSQRFTRYNYEYSAEIMDHLNEKIEPLGQAFSYPERTAKLRTVEDYLMYRGKTLPGFSMLLTPAIYSWLLILALFYGLRGKNTCAISLLFVPLAIMLMYILGPCNGTYGRYAYPLVVSAPMLIPMFLVLMKKRRPR